MNNIDKINKILKEVTNKKTKLNPNKNLFKQGLDSLDVTTFLLALESLILNLRVMLMISLQQ